MARSSCSLFEKSESFISCGTVSFGCFLWRKKAFSTLSDVRGLILGMLVTCSYAQAAIYGISLRDIWWVMHEHHQFQWSCVTTYSKHGASNQRCAGFRPGVSYIKLTRSTWSKWLCTLLGWSSCYLFVTFAETRTHGINSTHLGKRDVLGGCILSELALKIFGGEKRGLPPKV